MQGLEEHDAAILWQYMLMGQPARQADCLLVLGSIDDRVAAYAAQLAQQFHYWYIVVSGGDAHQNDLLAQTWPEATEAEHFGAIMRAHCVTKSLLLETKAQNTGENATLSFALLQAQNTPMPLSIQIVTKPYMERRALATFQAQWPDHDAKLYVTSPPILMNDYFTSEQPREKIINIMVGDMQRIIAYPSLGFQTEQVIPAEVRAAYSRLIAAGYTHHLQNY